MKMEEKEIMTAKELAEYLSFSPGWVRARAEAGELPGTKLGNRWRFKRSVIDKWMEERALEGIRSQAQGKTRAKSQPKNKFELEGRIAKGFNFIKERGEITTKDYARRFKISEATARKDLNELIKRGLIKRIGGGPNIRYVAR